MNSLLQTFCLAFVLVLLLPSCVDKHLQKNSYDPHAEKVGSRYFTWTDRDRADEIYEKGEYRDVLAQLWYPISENTPDGFEAAPYMPFLEEAKTHLSSWNEEDFLSVNDIQTLGLLNAPILKANKKYPLIVLAPALGAHSSYYTTYAERFAQNGYVVLGINFKYESEYVLGEDKKVTVSKLHFHDSLKTLKIPEQITTEGYREAKAVRLRFISQDLLFAIDQLAKDEELKAQIDFENIGVMGHSIGGFAAVYTARADKRIKACINLDGTPPPEALEEGMDQPLLFVEDLTDYRNHKGYKMLFNRREGLCEKVKSESYRVLIGNTNHAGFYSSNLRFAESEEEKAKAAYPLNITYSYSLKFFDKFLQGKDEKIEAMISDSLEVFVYN